MLPTRVRVFLSLTGFLLIATGLSARADDTDAVKEKLFQAKKAYDGEVRTFRKEVGDLLDKREDEARKAGNKKILDQINGERDRFEKAGDLPTVLPPAILTQIRTARADLATAYVTAVKDYLRLKEDSAAEATEKEQQMFWFSSALLFGKRTYLVALKHSDVKVENKWFANNGTVNGTVTGAGVTKLKLNGELVPHSIFLHPPSKNASQVRYPLAGNWTVFRATVGVPKIEDKAESPASPLTFEVLGDGKSLWKSKPVTKLDTLQTCELNVSKIKVLTLMVHCPEANAWARSVWFEPLLIE